MHVINVCKTYSNSAKKRNLYTKKHYFKLYFYDETGVIATKRVSRIEAFYYKYLVKKVKVKYFRCENCNEKYRSIHGKAPCPFCDNT